MSASSPAPIRVLVVDDESLARATLRTLLCADPEIAFLGECKDGRQAIADIRRLCPDLVFLDIEMAPALGGFEVLEKIGLARGPAVVFVTAHDEYAVRAFEIDALDYLLKPFTDERFRRTLARAKTRIRKGQAQALARDLAALLDGEGASPPPPPIVQRPPPLERIAVPSSGHIHFVRVAEIDWIEAQDYYVQLHAASRTHLLRESLRDLETRLDPSVFVRTHRSAIVNLARVKELVAPSGGEPAVILDDGTHLPLSRSRRRILRELLRNR